MRYSSKKKRKLKRLRKLNKITCIRCVVVLTADLFHHHHENHDLNFSTAIIIYIQKPYIIASTRGGVSLKILDLGTHAYLGDSE